MAGDDSQVRIPETELEWMFVRAGGPGGQNVNKVASKAVLRWSVLLSSAVSTDVKLRLQAQQRRRITREGVLVLSSQRFREQEKNRQDCLEKLREIVQRAAAQPRARKPTKRSRASHARRLAAKRHRSRTKKIRRQSVDE